MVFFTQSEVDDGKVFFQAFDVDERTDDDVELELRGDRIQPARFKWNIDIRPVDKRLGVVEPGSRPATSDVPDDGSKATPNMVPELSHHGPVLLLFVVVAATIIVLCCRKGSKKKEKKLAATRDEQGLHLNLSTTDERELPPISEIHGAELLDSTVYASVGRQRRSTLKDIIEEPETSSTTGRRPFLANLESLDRAPSPPHVKVTPLRQPLGSAGSAFKPTPLASLSKISKSGPITGLPSSSAIPSSIRQPRGSLDAAQSKATKLKQSQYWV